MTKSPRAKEFLVEVATLRRTPGSERRLSFEGALSDLEIPGCRIPKDEPVRCSFRLESVSEGILVSGSVTASWVSTCRRCLEEARGSFVAQVRELCVEEVADEDESLYRLGAYELDLEPIVHDACILELPLAPLCHEGCLGLCPICGTNRNIEGCSCVPEPDSRFAVLSLLREPEPSPEESKAPNR